MPKLFGKTLVQTKNEISSDERFVYFTYKLPSVDFSIEITLCTKARKWLLRDCEFVTHIEGPPVEGNTLEEVLSKYEVEFMNQLRYLNSVVEAYLT